MIVSGICFSDVTGFYDPWSYSDSNRRKAERLKNILKKVLPKEQVLCSRLYDIVILLPARSFSPAESRVTSFDFSKDSSCPVAGIFSSLQEEAKIPEFALHPAPYSRLIDNCRKYERFLRTGSIHG